jgi:hypothetical protein
MAHQSYMSMSQCENIWKQFEREHHGEKVKEIFNFAYIYIYAWLCSSQNHQSFSTFSYKNNQLMTCFELVFVKLN